MDWMAIKTNVTDVVGLSRDALHLVAGFGAQILLVLAFRSTFRAIWPLLVIALATLGNEWLDLTIDVWPVDARNQQWWESGKDFVLTLAIPVALVALTRGVPGRFLPAKAGEGSGSGASDPPGESEPGCQ